MINNIVVTGLQWGDEGKGKIVDFISDGADAVVRFQGGDNAGHTIVHNNKTYKLSILPSGVLHENVISVIGNGTVIQLETLQNEIAMLGKQGINITPDNLFIAENTPIILKLHQDIDKIIEERRGNKKIGTTGKGIGPCYEDKIGRRAIRICDLDDDAMLHRRIKDLLEYYHSINLCLESNIEDIKSELLKSAEFIRPFVKPVWQYLYRWSQEEKHIIFEGAQGFWLDIDHGTYPFVTSSSTVASQCYSGTGLGLGSIDHVIGVAKAYTTRVGMGPMFSEDQSESGKALASKGKEFGTVTGRARRCGWFDAVATRQASQISGVHSIALTKLDILDGFKMIKICTRYKYKDHFYDYLPPSPSIQSEIQPIYEEVEGWCDSSIAGIKNKEQLPQNALNYIKKIEELIQKPVSIVSTGPERADTILTH